MSTTWSTWRRATICTSPRSGSTGWWRSRRSSRSTSGCRPGTTPCARLRPACRFLPRRSTAVPWSSCLSLLPARARPRPGSPRRCAFPAFALSVSALLFFGKGGVWRVKGDVTWDPAAPLSVRCHWVSTAVCLPCRFRPVFEPVRAAGVGRGRAAASG